MITMTEFIEKVDAIMGQKNMDDKKANQLCHLYAMIFKNGCNAGYNACVVETAGWLKATLWKNPDTDKIECGCMDTSMDNFIEDYKRRLKD